MIQFAKLLGRPVQVIFCTQPDEPMVRERVEAMLSATLSDPDIKLNHYGRTIEQDPSAPGFWDMWKSLMVDTFNFHEGDYIVASEPYGQRLAELLNGTFFPYDIDRQLNNVKATYVRLDPLGYFAQLLPEFRKYIRTRITIFGAESTGKTTLAKELAYFCAHPSYWLCEWARPYLEETGDSITVESMTNIWHGQFALQQQIDNLFPRPVVFQDTDLFSTLGYWRFAHWNLGDVPPQLIKDAKKTASDLYIVTPSNIPFEKDPIRYGGDVRESEDQYWIDLLEEFNLPYIVLDSSSRELRMNEALDVTSKLLIKKNRLLEYDRKGF